MVREPKQRGRMTAPKVIITRRPGYYGMTGYRSARTATDDGRSYSARPSTAHEGMHRTKLINQSRDFWRNNGIYKGMIDRAVGYIIANGFELQVKTASAATNKKIEGLWRDYWRRPEVTGKLSGQKLVQMICREVIVAGDVAALKAADKKQVQLFEAEQIAGKSYKDSGIKTDEFGRPATFYLCPWKDTGVDTRKPNEVAAENVLYVANLERPSQLRGVPALQSSFAMMHRINDVCDSEAIAWQLLARLAVSVTREQGPQQAYTEAREDDTKDDTEGDLASLVTDVDYALMFHANPGEEIKGIERNIPGQNFSESLRMFLRIFGLPLGIPLEIVLLDWTQSNYSQSRAVLQQTYQTFLNWQELIESCFYRRLFEWKLSHWREDAGIGKKVDPECDWIKPAYPWLDQLKEAQAWSMQVERGFVTHAQVCKSLNSDRAEVIERREHEVKEAIEIAQRIETETGVLPAWEIFAGLKTAAPAKVPPAEQEESADTEENAEQEQRDEQEKKEQEE